MDAGASATEQAAAEAVCISCANSLGPDQAEAFRGRPCPTCGGPWERPAAASERSGLPQSPLRVAVTLLLAFAAGAIAVALGLMISARQELSSPGNLAEGLGRPWGASPSPASPAGWWLA